MRRNQKQVWLDKDFVRVLERMKANRLMLGKKESLADISKQIIKNPNFQQIEREFQQIQQGLLRFDK